MAEKALQHSTENLMRDELSRSRDLLLALSRAAQSIQRARTAEEVYRAIGDQVKFLGGDVSLLMLEDGDPRQLAIVYTSYESSLLRHVEQLTGLPALGYRFVIQPDDIFSRSIADGKIIYARQVKEYTSAMLPRGLKLLAGKVLNVLKVKQGIFAPLRVDERTLGMMVVSGLSLTENDVPAMESFAAQIAISLDNLDLTQKMQDELSARRQAEENMILQSAALEAAANAIAITDTNGTLQWVNQAWVELTGYSKEEAIGQNARIVKSGKHDPQFYKNMWNTILTGKVWRGEMTNRRKDGSLYHEEQTITPVLDGRGNVTHFIAIKLDITDRKKTEARLEYLARTDALTGVYNRRYLLELAEHEFDVARRYSQPLSVIMFDLDHFKNINDTFGHILGDRMLQGVAQITRSQLRDVDLFGRYGGEEFVIVLPVTSAQQAGLLAERIRSHVESFRVKTDKDPAFVTLSAGIAEILHEPQDGSVYNLIRRADKAMYAAKQSGRNRTVIFDSDLTGAV